jgi:hypothetical protein
MFTLYAPAAPRMKRRASLKKACLDSHKRVRRRLPSGLTITGLIGSPCQYRKTSSEEPHQSRVYGDRPLENIKCILAEVSSTLGGPLNRETTRKLNARETAKPGSYSTHGEVGAFEPRYRNKLLGNLPWDVLGSAPKTAVPG